MREWVVIVGAGLLTYMSRASFLLLGNKIVLPPFIERSLRYVAPASFAGIAGPSILAGEAGVEVAKVAGAAVALAIVWKTRNLVACMVIGMLTLWMLQWLGL